MLLLVAHRTSTAMDSKVAFVLMLACVVASYADPDAAGDAAAYGGMSFNRELPYVPRYRYKIRPYIAEKRMDDQERTWRKIVEFLMREGN